MARHRFVRLLSALVATWALSTALAVAQSKAPADPDAVFNVQSKIFHRATCSAARRCTKNCIVVKLSEAVRRGGRPCQICRGPSSQAFGNAEGSPFGLLAAYNAEVAANLAGDK